MANEKGGMDAPKSEHEQHMDDAVDCALISDLLERVSRGGFHEQARFVLVKDKRLITDERMPLTHITRGYLRTLLNGVMPDAWVQLGPSKRGARVFDAAGKVSLPPSKKGKVTLKRLLKNEQSSPDKVEPEEDEPP